MRESGITIVIYLDDIIVIVQTKAECNESAQKTLKLLQTLGIVITREKSRFVAATRCKFVRFNIDSVKMSFLLPDEKRKGFSKLI